MDDLTDHDLDDVTALHDDAVARGWHTEIARHARVIASLQHHIRRFQRHKPKPAALDPHPQGRLIAYGFVNVTNFAARALLLTPGMATSP